MQNFLRRQGMDKLIFLAAFTLLIMILPAAFLHEKTARILFYWCGYISVIGIITGLCYKRKLSTNKTIALLFLLLSLMFAIWSLLSSYISGDHGVQLLYTPAKRWFIASVIAFYILNSKDLIKGFYRTRVIFITLTIAFVFASFFGIIQGINSSDRILLGINRATLTAYAYSAFALAYSSLIASYLNKNHKFLLQAVVVLISTYVIFLTQTRSAMFIHPVLSLMLLFICLYKEKLLNIKILAASVVALILVVAFNHNILIKRYESTEREVQAYNAGNDATSLGARFSMWKLGIIAFKEAPFGQSESHRNHKIMDYLKAENKKSDAVQYLEIHLHNEFIQYASLFGIFGIIVLTAFFFTLIFKVSMPAITGPVGISALSTLLYGATDVLLTSIEFIVFLTVTIILAHLVTLYIKNPDDKA